MVLVGHDWGAPICWNAAIIHPGLVRGVVGMSVPYTPASGFSLLDLFDQLYADRFFYMLHFQDPGVIEGEFAADVRAALKKVYFALSGDVPAGSFLPDAPRGTSFLSLLPEPPAGPLSFLSDAELDESASTFERTGFIGAFNRSRSPSIRAHPPTSSGRPSISRPTSSAARSIPSGQWSPEQTSSPTQEPRAPTSRGSTIVEGAGHWVHQEAPEAVNAALNNFLTTL